MWDIAKKCDYGTHKEDMIQDHLIQTMLNNKLCSKAIQENWVLDRILTEAALKEQTTEQAEAMRKKLDDERSSESIKKINTSRWDRPNTASVGIVEIQTDIKHALLWELHAITVENWTTMQNVPRKVSKASR